MFTMNSKVFQDDFLTNESDKNILKAQYVIVSSRIRKQDSSYNNIISAYNFLFPNGQVLGKLTDEDVREEYFNQLESVKPTLSTLILGSIDEKFNIIFICTKCEDKLHYLQYLSEYIYMEFGYPVYEYKSYASGRSALREYDIKKVKKKCNKILAKAKKRQYQKDLKTDAGRSRIKSEFKSRTKKEMQKELEARNLYIDGMSKKEMLEMFELFVLK
jgi:hypothetical protein